MMSHAELERCIANLCEKSDPTLGLYSLLSSIETLLKEKRVAPIFTRTGWYLPGGLIAGDGTRIAESLIRWFDDCSSDWHAQGLQQDRSSGLFTTRWVGKHHYLSCRTGPEPTDWLQIELQELCERKERRIEFPDERPESLESWIEGSARKCRDRSPTGQQRYCFVRMLDMRQPDSALSEAPMGPFYDLWCKSSAGTHARFEQHWAIGSAKEFRTATLLHAHYAQHGTLIEALNQDALPRGSELAQLIHGYDRQLGYPMAWFFSAVCDDRISVRLALSVLEDIEGDYSYLPDRDSLVLSAWLQERSSTGPSPEAKKPT